MNIIHKAPNGGTTNLQTLAAGRAARALAVNDGTAEAKAAAGHKHSTPAAGEALVVPVREVEPEPAARPNMAPIMKQRVASVGAGSTRSVPHAPFVPNASKASPSSSVGGGQARRPVSPAPLPETVLEIAAAHQPAPSSVGTTGRPPVTAESIAAAIAASKPAPRAMAPGKPKR